VPKYKYRCADCDHELVAFHSIQEKLRDCLVCGVIGSLVRVPGTFVSNTAQGQQGQAGSLVKEKIEEFREDLEKQKRAVARKTHD
jgi:putative FmdB family regulatory protein